MSINVTAYIEEVLVSFQNRSFHLPFLRWNPRLPRVKWRIASKMRRSWRTLNFRGGPGNSPNPSSLCQAMQTQEKSLQGNFVYWPLDPETFSQFTLWTIILPTNQSKRASDNAGTTKFRATKVKSEFKYVEGECRLNESDISSQSF